MPTVGILGGGQLARMLAIAASLDAFRERQTAGVLAHPDPRTPPRS